jgi:hypothetical protein
VENMWKIDFPVENFKENITDKDFHRAKTVLTCGNVEKLCLIIDANHNI